MLARLTHLANCVFLVRGGYVPSKREKMEIGIGFAVFALVLYLLTGNIGYPFFLAAIPAAVFFNFAKQSEEKHAETVRKKQAAEERDEGDDHTR